MKRNLLAIACIAATASISTSHMFNASTFNFVEPHKDIKPSKKSGVASGKHKAKKKKNKKRSKR